MKAADAMDDVIDDLPDELEHVVTEPMEGVARRAANEAPEATGRLVQSLRDDGTPAVDAPRRSLSSPGTFIARSTVGVPGVYAYTEYGTGTYNDPTSRYNFSSPDPAPPIEPIVRWITAKGITPREYDTTYGLAAAIQQTIGQFGTRAHPFMRPAWHDSRTKRDFRSEARTRVRAAVKRPFSSTRFFGSG